MAGKEVGVRLILSYESLVHAVAGAAIISINVREQRTAAASHSSLKAGLSICAAGGGSVTAMTFFYPLDTARLRLQVDERRNSRSTLTVLLEIIKEEGILALYRGWFPMISSLCCSNFVYFYTFNCLKALWHTDNVSKNGKDLIIGFIAGQAIPYGCTARKKIGTVSFTGSYKGGVINVLLTNPLWVVNTRLKLQGAKFKNSDIIPTTYMGIKDTFIKILQKEGLLALWSGTLASLLLVFNPAIQFMIYEGLKRQLLKKRKELSSMEVFTIGAIAKTFATMLTYPLQIVQSVMRLGHKKVKQENINPGSFQHLIHLLRKRISCSETSMKAELNVQSCCLFFWSIKT
uniref:Peroxisomal membrane protein PMP34 n=1 Tax=Leptobrachium leishanense TaxID=445787 RepID=A0A8C5Q4N8_9ANUR